MMEPLQIKSSTQTPEMLCDGNNGYFSIAGKSYPDNVNAVYEPLFEYLKQYKEQAAPRTVLEFNWLYYNTATSKIIVKIIRQFQDMNTLLEIRWHFAKSTTIIRDKGQEIALILGVEMNYISH